MNPNLSPEAETYAEDLLLEAVKIEEDDNYDFPDDDHQLHYAREALAYIRGGRFPHRREDSNRMNFEEFMLFMNRKCNHQVSTTSIGLGNYCGEDVQNPNGKDLFPESTCCKEHAQDERDGY